MRNVSSADEHLVKNVGGSYLHAGSVYVASTLYIIAWGTVLTFVGRTPLRTDQPATWICAGLTLAALIGLSWLITVAARGMDVGGARFRKYVLSYFGACVLAAAVCAVVGSSAYFQLAWLATLILICGAFAVALVSTPWGLVGVLVCAPGCLAITGALGSVWIFVTVLLANVVYVRLAMWIFGLMRQLDSARRTIAAMSVEQERLRFARDLHDVVGRSLSSIALKSELALAADADLETRDTHVRDARDIAHRALGDMRALVRGYRDVDLGSELDDALMLLRSASVFVEAEGDAGVSLTDDSAKVAAWIVREAATNILKHAPDATECTIVLADGTVEITNDGVRTNEKSHDEDATDDGSGLVGLRERVEAIGGTFETDTEGDRFRIRCTLPVGPTTTSRIRRRRNSRSAT